MRQNNLRVTEEKAKMLDTHRRERLNDPNSAKKLNWSVIVVVAVVLIVVAILFQLN